ncbi:MAG: hypothetical protein AB7D19_11855 [Acetobacter sp.]|uniref:N-acetyltransferase domain-containing protein n=1 Tax=Acidomonas methanolica NBRC 104435 TaxID=1231351 RepID=A0A023D3C0_ACIMT|nr:hypothetical protein [Acidomonas methanolica]GAJ28301.1 hypothetical protein Amme_018_026 [Acidomonas methanolica NBRC 104435]GBQ55418.1 hypothetical protein AA0498_2252 [Acidomonas methanolica]GEK97896.1 hypothetical protein AME01nite_03950 [Acidomonas methanolica NBRC 104435]
MCKHIFATKSKGPVTIDVLSENQVDIYDASGASIGQFSFKLVREPSSRGDDDDEYLYLTHMNIVSDYKRQGIGEECLRKAQFEHGGNGILAADDDGTTRENGSHLVEDGPGFIAAMRKKGVILR